MAYAPPMLLLFATAVLCPWSAAQNIESAPPADASKLIRVIVNWAVAFDEGEDFVFFADEAGSWQVDVDWREVLPAYFRCLSRTSEPEDYASTVTTLIERFVGSGLDSERAGGRPIEPRR